MIEKTTINEFEKLDEVISTLLKALANSTPGTEAYDTLTKQLTELYKTRASIIELKLKEQETFAKQQQYIADAEQKAAETKKLEAETECMGKVKPETLALIGANLAGVLVIVWHERANVITSKALGFVGKILR